MLEDNSSLAVEPQAEEIPLPPFSKGELSLASIVEALLFAAPEPMSKAQLVQTLSEAGVACEPNEVAGALEQLQLTGVGSTLELVQVAEGYAFRTKAQFAPYVRPLFAQKPVKLSNAQLEVLSIVAYRQPITRLEIEEIRGVDCSAGMRRLLGLGLVKILGKADGLGRPLLYGTTKQFLQFFGLNSLHDMPTLKDYQELDKNEVKASEPSESDILIDVLSNRNLDTFSERTEKMSEEALLDLEQALNMVAKVNTEWNKINQ